MATVTEPPAGATIVPAPRRARVRSGRGVYWLYLIPGAVLFLGVIVVPFFMNLYYSMTRWAGIGDPKWIGFDNYTRLFTDETFWLSFRNSVAMIVAMVIVPTLIGLLLAAVLFDYLGKRFDGRVASVLRATYYLPQILPVAVAGILWGWVLNPQTGALNVILRSLGLESWALN